MAAPRPAGSRSSPCPAGRADPGPRPQRLLEAKRRLEEQLAVEQAANSAYEHYRAHGRQKNGRLLGAPPKPYTPPAVPDGKINITDLDSRFVHGMRGWVQGYNAQAVCNDQHLILAADVMTASADFGHLGPLIAQARDELAAAGVSEDPALLSPTPAIGTWSR